MKRTRYAAALGLLGLLLLPGAGRAGTIDTGERFAWSETGGWLDGAAGGGGVGVYDDHLEGFAWAENLGWIKLGSHAGGGYFTYANSTSDDWGVNLNGQALSGYAWSETAGWIDFGPSGGGVTLDPASGVFAGYAWAENLGWLQVRGTTGSGGTYGVLHDPEPQVRAVVVPSAAPLQVRAAIDGAGIQLSSDGGTSWSAGTVQPTDLRLKAMVIDPQTPTILYAATHGSGVFASSTGGDNWTACANTGLNPNVYSLVIGSNGTLSAATKGGVFSSSDCATWSAATTGLPSSGGRYSRTVLAVDPATPTTLYAGIDGSGVYKSSDSGANWSAATTQPANLNLEALVINPDDSTKLYAATYGAGVFASSDAGDTWSACTNTNLTNLNLLSLLDTGGKLYAGTEAGVFVSENQCSTWNTINTGLPE